MTLFVLPVAILEIVWVAEKVYRLSKKTTRELVEAILKTPELKLPSGPRVQTRPRHLWDTKDNVFADAVMGYWGLEEGHSTVYTYDQTDFKKISGLQVRRP